MSLSMKGKKKKPFSDEARKNMSIARKGNKNKAGKRMSSIAKQKISNANKGRSAWNKGVPRTEEDKLKMKIGRDNSNKVN